MRSDDPLWKLFEQNGIADPAEFLREHGEDVGLSDAGDPDVMIRGNIQMMLSELRPRVDVDAGLASLKLL